MPQIKILKKPKGHWFDKTQCIGYGFIDPKILENNFSNEELVENKFEKRPFAIFSIPNNNKKYYIVKSQTIHNSKNYEDEFRFNVKGINGEERKLSFQQPYIISKYSIDLNNSYKFSEYINEINSRIDEIKYKIYYTKSEIVELN